MTKKAAHFVLYLFLFFGITFLLFAMMFLVNSSAIHLISKLSALGISYFYFYRLCRFLASLKKQKADTASPDEKRLNLVTWFVFLIHLVLVNTAGEKLMLYLLMNDHQHTTASIRDCEISKGSEYCIYTYVVDNNHYEIKYCNEPDNLKLKQGDTVTVLYYTKFPVISKLKKELEPD